MLADATAIDDEEDRLDDALAARIRPDPLTEQRQRRYAAELAIAQRRAERREEIMTAYMTGVVTASEEPRCW